MAKSSAAGLLTSVDSMFTTQEERDNAQRSYVIDLPAAQISDFPDHPFKVRMDESMMELADSVKQHGILEKWTSLPKRVPSKRPRCKVPSGSHPSEKQPVASCFAMIPSETMILPSSCQTAGGRQRSCRG